MEILFATRIRVLPYGIENGAKPCLKEKAYEKNPFFIIDSSHRRNGRTCGRRLGTKGFIQDCILCIVIRGREIGPGRVEGSQKSR
jgi:hypothetical protein